MPNGVSALFGVRTVTLNRYLFAPKRDLLWLSVLRAALRYPHLFDEHELLGNDQYLFKKRDDRGVTFITYGCGLVYETVDIGPLNLDHLLHKRHVDSLLTLENTLAHLYPTSLDRALIDAQRLFNDRNGHSVVNLSGNCGC